jgi:hypothetical protein
MTPPKKIVKATNYTLIIVLAGSILFIAYTASTVIINTMDLNIKNQFGMYLLWVAFILVVLYNNL